MEPIRKTLPLDLRVSCILLAAALVTAGCSTPVAAPSAGDADGASSQASRGGDGGPLDSDASIPPPDAGATHADASSSLLLDAGLTHADAGAADASPAGVDASLPRDAGVVVTDAGTEPWDAGVYTGGICSGSNLCWANSPSRSAMLTGIWGTGAQDIWASGDLNISPNDTPQWALLHWDGSAWTAVPHNGRHWLTGVGASSTTNGWGVGPVGTLIQWDGATWRARAGVSGWLNATWVLADSDAWVVGMGGRIQHYNGTSWSPYTSTYMNPSLVPDLIALWGTASDNLWAVGSRSGIIHWNGNAWTWVNPHVTCPQFNAVFGSGPNDVWAAGRLGVVTHWDGTSWTSAGPLAPTFCNGGACELVGGFAFSPSDAWVVGQKGLVMHWTGASWNTVHCSSTNWLHGVWGASPDDVWIVGDDGAMLHWNGSSCTPYL